MHWGDKTWEEYQEKAAHYKAIGETDIHLQNDNLDCLPWHLVDRVRPGGAHRLDIETSLEFSGISISGLMFSWYVDIEDRDASGFYGYKINTDTIREIYKRVSHNPAVKAAVDSLLEGVAEAVEKRGRDWMDAAVNQMIQAEVIRHLAKLNLAWIGK